MNNRCFHHLSGPDLLGTNPDNFLDLLTGRSQFPVERTQRDAWRYEIMHLKQVLASFEDVHVFFEFTIPRMGRRADVILLLNGVIFVVEYKVGSDSFFPADIDQTVGYALDLSNFHDTSHDRKIVPVLVATKASHSLTVTEGHSDNVHPIVRAAPEDLVTVLSRHAPRYAASNLDPVVWASGQYRPTPTIIEAAQALYRGHTVDEISRSEAGVDNLSKTSAYIDKVINDSRAKGKKAICFVTGVPGSGKTLAGLNIANSRIKAHGDGHAIFLSGNGPLVAVLQAALAEDRLAQQRTDPTAAVISKKSDAEREAKTFIQNIHHFRDEYVRNEDVPPDRIVVFDEAQRAWNKHQTTKFMQKKRGQAEFSMSEPEFLLSVMNRHTGWATVICLVGGGQEINTGEAGISEWLDALRESFPDWTVHISPEVTNSEYLGSEAAVQLLAMPNVITAPSLHLAVSLRSFRAESLSEFIGATMSGDITTAQRIKLNLVDYPLFVTRDLGQAREWLKAQRRGQERTGLLASSNALRLKPEGVFVKSSIDPCKWFLAPPDDIRSSVTLEDAGSEFDVQGLELDWTCLCWDANLRWRNGAWATFKFSGTAWQNVAQPNNVKFVINSYRVLLTRARQGMIIFVPKGDQCDVTRPPSMYDPTYQFLREIGIRPLPARQYRQETTEPNLKILAE